MFLLNNITPRITNFPIFFKGLFLLFIDLFSIFIVITFSNLLLSQFSKFDMQAIFHDAFKFSIICELCYFLSDNIKSTKFSTNLHFFNCLYRNILTVLIIIYFGEVIFFYFSLLQLSLIYLFPQEYSYLT